MSSGDEDVKRLILPIAFVLGFTAVTTGSVSTLAASSDLLIKAACALPGDVLLRVWRGVRTDRSAQLQIVAKRNTFVDGGLTHATPYDYTQRVPMFWYGPGIVPAVGTVNDAVTSADISPTQARLLGFPGFHAIDGKPLPDVLMGASGRTPKLLVTLVWDAGGIDVLDAWEREWPFLHSLIRRGVWYSNATVGSSPSDTPAIHATIGTGAYPRSNGMLDEYISMAGQIQKPNENGPAFLLEPTLADLYDRAMGNRPVVGGIATLSAHESFLGHGSMWGGGDKDIAVTREKTDASTAGAEDIRWGMTPAMAPFFDFPSYVNELPPLRTYFRETDAVDGKVDGTWEGHAFSDLNGGFDTPARTPLETTLIRKVVQQEGFGRDDVPDVLQINYKAIDTISHLFSLNSPEMRDTVAFQDDALRALVSLFNSQVGKGRWAMVLTADHGAQYDPAVSGYWQIGIDQLQADIEKRFDDDSDTVPLVEKIRPTQVWINMSELADNGATLEEISQFILGLTERDTIKPSVGSVQPGKAGEKVFAAAFPTTLLERLPCLPGGSPQ